MAPIDSRRVRDLLLAGLLALTACSSSNDAAPEVERSTTTIAPTMTAEPQVADETTTTTQATTVDDNGYDFSAVDPIVADFVDTNGLSGAGLIVVDAQDGVVHHDHWGEFNADRISLVASSSKMITAGVLLRLDDDGLLDIDAPVADAVDWGAANPSITPAQLLSNSSGLVGLLPNPAYGPYVCQFLPAGDLEECGEAIFTTPDDDADIAGPDSEFRYGGAQWQVAGALAEAVSGKSWDALIQEIYVEPCELDVLAYNNHFTQLGPGGFDYPTEFNSDPTTLAPTANPSMEGGAYVTTGDYGKLLLMHLRGGDCNGQQVLSPEALDRMHSDRLSEAYDGNAGGPGTGYGMGWWVDRSTGRISDAGAYGSVPWLDLEDGYGAFLVIEATSGTGNELAGQLYDDIEEAMTSAD